MCYHLLYISHIIRQLEIFSFFCLRTVIRIMTSLLVLFLIINFNSFKFVKHWSETLQFPQRYSWISYLYSKTVIILTPGRRNPEIILTLVIILTPPEYASIQFWMAFIKIVMLLHYIHVAFSNLLFICESVHLFLIWP